MCFCCCDKTLDQSQPKEERVYLGLWFQSDGLHHDCSQVVAEAGSWLITFPFTQEQRERENRKLGRLETLTAYYQWHFTHLWKVLNPSKQCQQLRWHVQIHEPTGTFLTITTTVPNMYPHYCSWAFVVFMVAMLSVGRLNLNVVLICVSLNVFEKCVG